MKQNKVVKTIRCSNCTNEATHLYKDILLCLTCTNFVSSDAPITRIDSRKPRKRIDERKVKKDYKGEASPYNEWLERKGDYNQEHNAAIPINADQDIVAEEQGMYFIKSDINEDQMEKFKKALPLLTENQKLILQMAGYEGKTLANIGAMLGLSRGNVLDTLNRARKIIKDVK